jgi:hypothetical protein
LGIQLIEMADWLDLPESGQTADLAGGCGEIFWSKDKQNRRDLVN